MRKVIVNFSGGKDSTGAILKTLKVYPKEEITLCYQDTGAEYLETEGHVKLIANTLELPLVVLKGRWTFWEYAKYRGYFPTPAVRDCTSHLKRDVFNHWVTENYKGKGHEIIVVSGIRGEESLSRSRKAEWETPEQNHLVKSISKVWFPCLDMSTQEVKDMVKAEGLPLHPCYEFSTRCSCWSCIFHPNTVVRTYAEAHPELYEHACLVEDEIKHKWKEHFAINDLMKQGRLI